MVASYLSQAVKLVEQQGRTSSACLLHYAQPLCLFSIHMHGMQEREPKASTVLGRPISMSYVLQANVWTEYISDEDTIEYMTFPRLAALAEAVWSTKANRDWADFKSRLPGFMKHVEAMGNKSRSLT